MKNNALISVIIPCFNSEDFVYECLESIPFTDQIEVIIVNDGSTDNSESEINRFISTYKSKISNILSINQLNKGLSGARNTGIEHATGKYISFLDSDDLWSPILWTTIRPILINIQPDMIVYNASRFYDDNRIDLPPITVTTLKDGYQEINHINELSGIFEANGWFAWCRIYKKELFDGIKFPERREYEDLATVPLITTKIKNIFSISESLILYRFNLNGITNTPKEKHIDDIIYAMKCLYNIYQNSNEKTEAIKTLAPTMKSSYSLLRTLSRKIYGYFNFNKKQRKEIKHILYPFKKEFKSSLRLKINFIFLFCITSKLKFIIRKKQ